jgi:choline dehydrogenase
LASSVVARPAGVGENLQDHLQIRTVFKVRARAPQPDSPTACAARRGMALEYALRRSGPMSMAPSQFGMFTRSDPEKATPDLEYHVQPLSTDKLGDPLHPFPAITVSVCNLRPKAAARAMRATDPAEPAAIRLNYLSTERDRRVAVASIRQARRIMTAQALQPYAPEEWLPGPGGRRRRGAGGKAGDIATTIFHPVGTCRMGRTRWPWSMPSCGSADFGGLRVVDASIMPTHRLGQHRLAGGHDRRAGGGPDPARRGARPAGPRAARA